MGKVESVSCLFRNTSLDIDAPDHAILNLFHFNGAISNLDLNFYYRKYVRNFQIATNLDMINYEPFGKGLKIGKENYINFDDFDFNQTYVDAVNGALSNENQKFPSLTYVDHLMHVTDACLISSKEDGKIIKVSE